MAFAFAAVLACLLSPASSAFAQQADLVVTKTGPASAAAGTNVTYTMNVLNVGPDDSASASLTDPIPPGMTFVSLSSPGGWSCTTPAVGAGGTVSCSNALFASGGNVNFTLTVAIPGGTPPGTAFTNIATVSAATFDPTDENNSSTAATFVSGAPSSDVRVTKAAPATVQAGVNLTYTIQTANDGPDAAASVQLTDTLPGGLTFVSLSSPGAWSCTTPAVGAGGTVSCSIASLASGASDTFTLTANVPPATPAGTDFTNTASISAATDPTPENDQSTVTTSTIAAAPDLAIAKTHSGNATLGQTGFAYTITVSNAGAAPSSGTTTVQDVLPAGLTATAMSGSGWTCTVATASCTRSDALGAGASYPPITLTVNVASNAPNVVTNTATVTNAGDADTSNNTASDPTSVTSPPGPDLSIAKTHSGDARLGQTGFVFTITVRNVGTSPSTGTVTVTDVLPAKLTATAVSGAGWTCLLGATPTCTRADPLAAGAAFPAIALTVSVAADAPPTVTNVATVSGGGDVNSNNNSASDQTNVGARSDPTRDPDVVGLLNAQMAAAQRFATTQISNFNERLEALHDDTTGDRMGLSFGGSDPDNCMIPGTSMPRDPFDPKCSKQLGMTDAFAYAPGGKAATKAPPPPAPRPASRDLAFWSTGYVSFGSADPTLQRAGIDFNTSGVSGGIDYRLGRSLILGIGAGYGRDRSRIGDNGTRSDGQAFNAAVYGSYRPFANTFLDAVLGHGVLRFNSQRFVVDDNAFVYGSRGGNQTFASLTAAYRFKQGAMMLSPYLRTNAAWVNFDSFTETGGVAGALTYSAQSAEFYTAVLGLRGRYVFLTEWGTFAPRFRVEYNHDFSGASGIFLQYSDLLSPVYSLSTAASNRDRMSFGLGADTLVSARHRVAADYQYDVDFLGSSWHRYKLRWDSKF